MCVHAAVVFFLASFFFSQTFLYFSRSLPLPLSRSCPLGPSLSVMFRFCSYVRYGLASRGSVMCRIVYVDAVLSCVRLAFFRGAASLMSACLCIRTRPSQGLTNGLHLGSKDLGVKRKLLQYMRPPRNFAAEWKSRLLIFFFFSC